MLKWQIGLQRKKRVVSSTTHEFYIELQQVFIKGYKEMVRKCMALEKFMTMEPNKSSPREKKQGLILVCY